MARWINNFKFLMRIASNRFNTASKKAREVVDGAPQSNRQTFVGCKMVLIRSFDSLKQHATSYANTGWIKLVSSASSLMPNIKVNMFKCEETNGGCSFEVSYTPIPAET